MEYAMGYVAMIFVLQAFIAVRNPYGDCRSVIVGTVFWPLFLVLVAGSFLLDAVKVGFDVAKSPKWFGFRRPTNTEVRGFAITLFRAEIQFWKVRKA